MTGRLAGRTAVIVGAGQTAGETIGNGRAVAVTFAREGARLVLVDVDPDTLAVSATLAADAARDAGCSTAPPVQVTADICADGGPEDLVAAAVDAFGGLGSGAPTSA